MLAKAVHAVTELPESLYPEARQLAWAILMPFNVYTHQQANELGLPSAATDMIQGQKFARYNCKLGRDRVLCKYNNVQIAHYNNV